jgi:hypothetical protein
MNITYSSKLGLFCAVSFDGTNRVMTSPDGVTWTGRTAAAANQWRGIAWSPELELFAAVSDSGTNNRVMTSKDGITWIVRNSASNNNWRYMTYSPDLALFCAVGVTGTGNRIMTSLIWN